jgi:cyclic pyranopterin phosphate synthase
MSAEAYALVAGNALAKGDVLGVARVAGLMAAKRTAELIPLCHPVALTHAEVELALDAALPGVRVRATASTVAGTGVEMEALTAATVAMLTVYDMVKGVDRATELAGAAWSRSAAGARALARGGLRAEGASGAGQSPRRAPAFRGLGWAAGLPAALPAAALPAAPLPAAPFAVEPLLADPLFPAPFSAELSRPSSRRARRSRARSLPSSGAARFAPPAAAPFPAPPFPAGAFAAGPFEAVAVRGGALRAGPRVGPSPSRPTRARASGRARCAGATGLPARHQSAGPWRRGARAAWHPRRLAVARRRRVARALAGGRGFSPRPSPQPSPRPSRRRLCLRRLHVGALRLAFAADFAAASARARAAAPGVAAGRSARRTPAPRARRRAPPPSDAHRLVADETPAVLAALDRLQPRVVRAQQRRRHVGALGERRRTSRACA